MALCGTPLRSKLHSKVCIRIYKVGTYLTNIKLQKITHEINFDMIVNQTYEIFFPMLVGGIIIAPLVWIITYYVIYSFIASYKKRKHKKTKGY